MSASFFETHKLALTPLSPLHVGCGEDYEPTGFVLDEDFLYPFDASDVPMSDEDLAKLLELARTPGEKGEGLCAIARFFDQRASFFKQYAQARLRVDDEAMEKLQKLYGEISAADICNSGFHEQESNGQKGENYLDTINQNCVPRTAYIKNCGRIEPYIPGTTLKGAIHTALLDRVHEATRSPSMFEPAPSERDPKRRNTTQLMDKLLLGAPPGQFQTSPMRMISVADMHSGEEDVVTRIIMSKRVCKDSAISLSEKKGHMLPIPIEVVEKAQYRAFWGELRLRRSEGRTEPPRFDGRPARLLEPRVEKSYGSVAEIISDLNRYAERDFDEQAIIWRDRGSAETKHWFEQTQNLLQILKPLMKQGRVALVRLGKFGGAENVTLRMHGTPKIEIKGVKEPQEFATTLAIACEGSENQLTLPFGWALLEIDPQPGESAILRWCEDIGGLGDGEQRD